MQHVSGFLNWVTGVYRPRKKMPQPHYLWQRPHLIDPPLRPLPSCRPRRLTSVEDTHDQLQSALIARLPAEVRVLIWEHVVGSEDDRDVLHLELADGILRHNRCYERESGLPDFQHDCWSSPFRKSFRARGRGNKEPENHRQAILPLLFTCKLIYTESVGLLYSANTFDFRRTDSVIRLPSVMLPHRVQQLRRVQVCTVFAYYHKWDLPPGVPADYWEIPDDRRQWPAACKVLASLQYLQYAHITIFLISHRHATDTELLYETLHPLKAVHASEFTVEVAMPLETVRERLGTTPFRLVEREYIVCSSPLSNTIAADSLAGTAILTTLAIICPSIA
ncbi:hypothetical protein K431DRAFT_41689 [Polychaeton citri CBS 116435]|uniref:DUF7730 domain-containing protein n=1 Tax=Polychaeton citri CBS 116435 TaxID=1314669 RepID=A0A9P4UQ94_9PEZI|nr:hypothetical protein K431DRAFT_41689 [Polychaeton citri CBS 116435]